MDYYSLDIVIFKWLNSWAGVSVFYDWAIIFRAEYLIILLILGLSFFCISGYFARFKEYKKVNSELFLHALVSSLVARFFVVELIRLLYNRPRPFEILDGTRQLINHSPGGSFPSGHATFAFAVAMSVAWYYPKLSLLFFAVALSIGLGRVAAGIHWPSDIVAGILVGILTSLMVNFIWGKFKRRSAIVS